MIRMLTDAPFDVGDYISLHRAQCAVSRRLAARLCGGSKTHQRLFLSHPGAIRALASAHGQFTANVPLFGLRVSRNPA